MEVCSATKRDVRGRKEELAKLREVKVMRKRREKETRATNERGGTRETKGFGVTGEREGERDPSAQDKRVGE